MVVKLHSMDSHIPRGRGSSASRHLKILWAIIVFSLIRLLVWFTSSISKNFQLDLNNESVKYGYNESVKMELCNRSQIVQGGSWIPSKNDFLFGPLFEDKNNTYQNYEYMPSANCELTRWDQDSFCELTKGAPILLVGDSLTFEHYQSLVHTLGGKAKALLQVRSRFLPLTLVHQLCNHSQSFVMYRRQDDLKGLGSMLNETFPIILILNRGAHYVPDANFISDLTTTFKHVRKWQQQCREYGVKCHFFWRTTVPGHPDCKGFSGPVNNITQMEELIQKKQKKPSYHWESFKHQNELVLDLLLKNMDDYNIIDAYPINILRPDQHTDCLHSLLPGKVDVYNRLLLHYLRQMRTMEDVQRLEKFQFPWNRTSNVLADGHDIIW